MSTTTTSALTGTPMRLVQGAVYRRRVTWKDSAGNPRDLTGRTGTIVLRRNLHDATGLLTATGGTSVVLGGAAGTIDLRLGADRTILLPPGTWVWALAVALDADPTEQEILLSGPAYVRATALLVAP